MTREHRSKKIPNGTSTEQDSTCYIRELHINNPTAGEITITVQDRQGSPVGLFPAIALPPQAILDYESRYGGLMTNGIDLISSAGGLNMRLVLDIA